MNTRVVFGKKLYLGSLVLTTSIAGIVYLGLGLALQVICTMQQRMHQPVQGMALDAYIQHTRTTSIQLTIIIVALALGWLTCSILLFSSKEVRLMTLRKQRSHREFNRTTMLKNGLHSYTQQHYDIMYHGLQEHFDITRSSLQ